MCVTAIYISIHLKMHYNHINTLLLHMDETHRPVLFNYKFGWAIFSKQEIQLGQTQSTSLVLCSLMALT